MNVLDLFSGIGGFSLGLERAGMRTVAFCECEPYARAVLRKHWPDVPCYDDVRTLTADRLRAVGELSYVTDDTYVIAEAMSKSKKLTEEQARIGALEATLEQARAGIKKAACAVFRIHEDDLNI